MKILLSSAANRPRITELRPEYDSRASFYGKARVIDYGDGVYELQSYDTIVARVENGKVTQNDIGKYSVTTNRHIREFLKQYADDYNG